MLKMPVPIPLVRVTSGDVLVSQFIKIIKTPGSSEVWS